MLTLGHCTEDCGKYWTYLVFVKKRVGWKSAFTFPSSHMKGLALLLPFSSSSNQSFCSSSFFIRCVQPVTKTCSSTSVYPSLFLSAQFQCYFPNLSPRPLNIFHQFYGNRFLPVCSSFYLHFSVHSSHCRTDMILFSLFENP